MKKLVAVASSVVLLLAFGSCGGAKTDESLPLGDVRTGELRELAGALTGYMSAGDEASALAMMDKTMRKAMEGKVAATWDSITKTAGAFIETGDCAGYQSDDYDIIEMTLVFEGGTYIQRAVFDAENLVAGLFFRDGAVEAEDGGAPDGMSEEQAAEELPNGVAEEQVRTDAEKVEPLE